MFSDNCLLSMVLKFRVYYHKCHYLVVHMETEMEGELKFKHSHFLQDLNRNAENVIFRLQNYRIISQTNIVPSN
jgi:hypothetical protein